MRQPNDPGAVGGQYADESRLATRASVWQPAADGRTPQSEAAGAVRAAHPTHILEVGCGTGAFARRLSGQNPSARVIAVDQSERLVALTRERGVDARVADIQDLPFADDAFDVVVALWVLYHVTDLDAGLAQVRRVLRPGGTLVAVSNGVRHLADLLDLAGGHPLVTGFSSENGEQALRRHFVSVQRRDLRTRAVMADHAAAQAYLATLDPDLAAGLPAFEGPREFAGATSVFIAR